MKTLNYGHLTKVAKLPFNIAEFLKDRPFQKESAKKVNRWLYSLYKRGIVGGTAIGKHYNTLILDVSYQGSEIYIDVDGEITIGQMTIQDKNEFKNEIEKYIEFKIME